ncbi:lysophospholipid acyltransferase family protein [Metabacillus iocasae]|uniref:1-acyl-sn-glycerol-3-phosphate acyltransferase n=1 Tax=Priestia iocasae TaxID=2291674 RepID=A0ABS2QXB7_9BACI|nr:lysophospholipid acyltransferase family protein [Metabacillus iocasae]MBM7703818.1 1-acyl-sn-glycerol-3-phosphate acyltransferase [Metabacillus iocasae]
MLYPKKSERFERLFYPFVIHQLKKHFYKVYLYEEENTLKKDPTIFVANHSSWWDGLLCFYLNKAKLQHDSYAMMSEQGMTDFSFFKKIGAFSINPSSPKHILQSLQFAAKLLNDRKSVWIFPQGKEEHLEKRPLQFSKGVSYILDHTQDVTIIPITFYYTFRHDQRPELFIMIGKSIPQSTFLDQSRDKITSNLETMVTKQLDALREKVTKEELDSFDVLLEGHKTMSEWLTWWKVKVKR